MLKRIIVLSMIFLLISQQIPVISNAGSSSIEPFTEDQLDSLNDEFIRILFNDDEMIDLQVYPTIESDIIMQIESNTIVSLVDIDNVEVEDDKGNDVEFEDGTYSQIEFYLESDEDSEEIEEVEVITGYVLSDHLYTIEEYEILLTNGNESFDKDEPVIDEVDDEEILDASNDFESDQESTVVTSNEDSIEDESFIKPQMATLKLQGQTTSTNTVLNGIALKDRTPVYSERSRNSSTLRSYAPGSTLMYWEFNSSWYEALVIIGGVRQTGYIHKDDVETLDLTNQILLDGIAVGRTSVYTRPSKSAGTHRSYQDGHILMYKTFSNEWYEAYVIIGGVGKTGYIHKSDVETLDLSNQILLNGIAIGRTNVYTKPSKSAGTHRSYQDGHILMYKTFSDEWYEAYVIIGGVGKTGYIHKNDVETLDLTKQATLNGIAIGRTNVYTRPSKSAGTHRSYQDGHILMYKTFSNEWYEAYVIINGQGRIGYIHARDVETITGEQISLEGYASAKTTRVYSKPSRKGKVLRSYPEGRLLYFKTFSSNWYEALVILNGKPTTGYIHHDDISFDPVIKVNLIDYNYTFKHMVDIQLTRTPKADGTGKVPAGRNLIEYYANPSNFRQGENGFYQFLVLSAPADLNVSEVNRNILDRSKGTLAGTAGAFVEAGKRYGINEAYLIAHALHETGNGQSKLAQGVTVNGKKVYNMFGTAAYDGSAVSSGAQYAYDQGWFSPEEAIIGGAQFVARNYIHAGQDTLYKMRWNPDNPGVHQYATHVAWAQITTNRIASIYNQLESYVQVFEVPKFKSQPGYSGPNPPVNNIGFSEYAKGAVGQTTGSNVRFRTQPSTSSNSSIITTIANKDTKLELLGTDNKGWYKAKYNGKEGWISADYVKALNVLYISASGLNVRPNPTTDNNPVGTIANGTFVTGVLDSNNNLVTTGVWYKVYFNNTEAWVSSGSNHQYIEIK